MAISNYKTWLKALKIIPGGNMLISKRPPESLIKKYPIYFSKCKGSYIWDLNGKKYLDMYLMGVGTNILGYNNEKVNQAVNKVIKTGNMSSLNSLEDYKLAKELIKINKWAGMVKFARTGGEANAIAVRIARASNKKDIIAFCGYHGWHDWYMAANLRDNNQLSSHLFKYLEATGVPKKLKNTTFKFDYGDFEKLKKIHHKYKLGIVKMEVCRNNLPNKNFLTKVRNFTKKNNIVLIFDECTTGFRYNYGGVHLTTGVNPDIAIFGKALGNGFAINAIIGKKKLCRKLKNLLLVVLFGQKELVPSRVLPQLGSWKRKNRGKKLPKLENTFSKN